MRYNTILSPSQTVLWENASVVKEMKDVAIPKLEVWNYKPCKHHKKPKANCEFQACGGPPFKHQRLTASFSYMARQTLVANSTGTGKTISALLTLALAHYFEEDIKAIIVVPTAAVEQWVSEVQRWTPGFSVRFVPSKTSKRDRIETYVSPWNILVIGYHVFRLDYKNLEDVGIRQVVVDDVDPSLNTKNLTYQALFAMCKRADLVIVQNATSLQASALSANVLTPSGWVKMRDIHPGSTVITPKGDAVKVLSTSERKVSEVYKVTLSDGSSTRVSGDHLWKVAYAPTNHSSGKAVRVVKEDVLSTEELLSRGLTVKRGPAIKRGGPTRLKFALPQPTLENLPEIDLPIPPYILGVLIGNGYLGKTSISFSTPDTVVVNRVSAELEEGLELHKVNAEDRVATYSIVSSGSRINPLAEAIKDLGLYRHRSYDKFIPEVYKHGSYLQRLDLLRGLMDTDGSASKCNGATYSTVSEDLAEDVANLTRSLGGWAKVHRRERDPKEFETGIPMNSCGYIYTVTVVMSQDSPFHQPRKTERWTECVRRTRRIESIERDGEEEVQCILIDDPEHLYVTDDYIVTHNTRLEQLYAASSLIGGKEVWGSKTNFTRNYVQRSQVNIYTEQGKRKVFQTTGYKNMAQPLDAKVLTPSGWVCIGDLTVGDEVIDSSGGVQHVEYINDLGVKDVWSVRLRDGSESRAAGDHLWTVRRQDGGYCTLLTTELMTKYKRAVAVPVPHGAISGTLKPLCDPYFMGYMLGDGCLKYQLTFVCHNDERDIPSNFVLPDSVSIRVAAEHENHTQYAIRTKEYYDEALSCASCGGGPVIARSLCNKCYQRYWRTGEIDQFGKIPNPLFEALKDSGIFERTGRDKILPSHWEQWSYDDRLSLLQGLLDSDGCIDPKRGRVTFVNVAAGLAEGVRDLARSLGMVSYLGKYPRTSNFNSTGTTEAFQVSVLWDGVTPLFKGNKKASKLNKSRVPKSVNTSRAVTSVTRLPDAPVRCIGVSSEDQLYITDSYMLTHNTDFRAKFEPMSVRFTYEDIKNDVTIPSLVSEKVYFDMSKKQLARYQELQDGVRTVLNDKSLPVSQKTVNALTMFTYGSQICTGLFTLKTSSGGYEKDSAEASPKLDWIMDKLQNEWKDQKVVIYSKFKGSIIALQDRLKVKEIGFSTIWGSETDSKVRKAEQDRFWQDPNDRVMIISVSGERSLNLQNASILVMWDLQLNPARLHQIAGRIRRAGSKNKKVFVFELLHRDSQEERYILSLSARQALFDFVYNVDDSDQDHDKMLIEKLDPEMILRLISP